MRAVLKLESIGDNYFAYLRHKKKTGSVVPKMERLGEALGYNKKPTWVARLLGYDGLNFEREFVWGQKDYLNSNGTGSRGVYIYYPLIDGIYEINERKTWRRIKRWYAKVNGDKIMEISKDKAIQCLLKII